MATACAVVLDAIAPGLIVTADDALAVEAALADIDSLVEAAAQTMHDAGLTPERIDAL